LISKDSKDFSDFFDISEGLGPVMYSCRFSRIDGDAVAIQVYAEEVDFIFFKEAFGGLEE